jgi:argininosuccinate lyase
VAAVYADGRRATELVAVSLATAQFDEAHMRARAGEQWASVTELADTLVRECGLPFVEAHAVVSALVAESRAGSTQPLAEALERVSAARGHRVTLPDAVITRALDPMHFVEVRRTLGGPSPDVMRTSLNGSMDILSRDRTDLSSRRQTLASAQQRLQGAVESL